MAFKRLLGSLLVLVCSVNSAYAGHGTHAKPEDPNNYDEAIQALVEEGIVKGNEHGDINPEGTLNRAELTAIVLRANGITPLASDKNCFDDVAEEWFAGVICAARRLQIINGYPDGKFRPGREVTAGEAAKIMVNALTEFSYQDLNTALEFVNGLNFHRQDYAVDQPIKRNEAFERLYRLRKANLFQHDQEGRGFDPQSDTIMVVEPDGPSFYLDFNQAQYERHLGMDPIILFFHASWCPLCRKSEQVLTENLDQLSGGVIWFKVDYDTALDLRRKYGVTMQDTFIAIDASGEVVTKRSGIPSAEVAQDLMDTALGN